MKRCSKKFFFPNQTRKIKVCSQSSQNWFWFFQTRNRVDARNQVYPRNSFMLARFFVKVMLAKKFRNLWSSQIWSKTILAKNFLLKVMLETFFERNWCSKILSIWDPRKIFMLAIFCTKIYARKFIWKIWCSQIFCVKLILESCWKIWCSKMYEFNARKFFVSFKTDFSKLTFF